MYLYAHATSNYIEHIKNIKNGVKFLYPIKISIKNNKNIHP